MKKSKILAALTAAAMAVATFVTTAVTVSAEGTYHAYLGIQEPVGWTFRNAWNDATYGQGVTSEDGMVFFDQLTGWDESNNALNKGGTFTDAEITYDGTYKVSLTGDFDLGTSETLSQLFVSTDIPLDAGVSVTDVKVIFDGNTKYTFDEAFLNPDEKEYVHILCINQWNSDLNELFGYIMPTSSVEIEFTVSGLGADPNAPAETEAETEATTEETTEATTEETTEATVEETEATTEAAAEETTEAAAETEAEVEESSSAVPVIVIAVIAVVVVAAVAVVIIKKKK